MRLSSAVTLTPLLLLLLLGVHPTPVDAADLATSLRGRILLQVESAGEAWYVSPDAKERYYLGRPDDAFKVMREQGLGIKHDELARHLEGSFPTRLSGKIMLDVEAQGQAYYVHPTTLKGHYLGRPDDAFKVMREQGLGITNANLDTIPTSLKSAPVEHTLLARSDTTTAHNTPTSPSLPLTTPQPLENPPAIVNTLVRILPTFEDTAREAFAYAHETGALSTEDHALAIQMVAGYRDVISQTISCETCGDAKTTLDRMDTLLARDTRLRGSIDWVVYDIAGGAFDMKAWKGVLTAAEACRLGRASCRFTGNGEPPFRGCGITLPSCQWHYDDARDEWYPTWEHWKNIGTTPSILGFHALDAAMKDLLSGKASRTTSIAGM